jgi:hypothetical protein
VLAKHAEGGALPTLEAIQAIFTFIGVFHTVSVLARGLLPFSEEFRHQLTRLIETGYAWKHEFHQYRSLLPGSPRCRCMLPPGEPGDPHSG